MSSYGRSSVRQNVGWQGDSEMLTPYDIINIAFRALFILYFRVDISLFLPSYHLTFIKCTIVLTEPGSTVVRIEYKTILSKIKYSTHFNTHIVHGCD